MEQQNYHKKINYFIGIMIFLLPLRKVIPFLNWKKYAKQLIPELQLFFELERKVITLHTLHIPVQLQILQ